jgi:hypothetical protein
MDGRKEYKLLEVEGRGEGGGVKSVCVRSSSVGCKFWIPHFCHAWFAVTVVVERVMLLWMEKKNTNFKLLDAERSSKFGIPHFCHAWFVVAVVVEHVLLLWMEEKNTCHRGGIKIFKALPRLASNSKYLLAKSEKNSPK